MLEQLHAKEDLDIFVATFNLLDSKQSGRIVSVSTWSKGVHTSLPKSDLVAFVIAKEGSDSFVKLVKWEDAVRIGGDLMAKEEGMYPVRYEIKDFPKFEVLESVETAEL